MKKFLLYVRQYFLIILGAAAYGIGTTCFIQAAKIATGGVVGVFNVVNLIHEIPVGLCVLIVNIPLIIISFFKFKPRFAINSMIGIVLTSAAIDLSAMLLGRFLPFTEDMLLSALAGALFNGAGTGLIMRNGSSTGGSDIITKLIHRKLRHLKGGVIAAALGLVVCVFYFVVTRDVQGTLYSALTIVVSNKVFDLVLYGGSDSKTVYIITDNSEKMAEAILTETHAGATILDGTGAYTKSDRKIILCVIRNSVFPTLKQLVKSVDENAFMIVTTSSEVFGKGYEDFNTERL
ncbi:MAG: YitT family protein [Clostridia bacterium]|nr:YitT family protein [Clostridia bacterium]MBR7033194.1 YitT family protein [Clostridia bacterium]